MTHDAPYGIPIIIRNIEARNAIPNYAEEQSGMLIDPDSRFS